MKFKSKYAIFAIVLLVIYLIYSKMSSPYTSQMGYDYPGNDIQMLTGTTHASCMAECDKNPGCIGFVRDPSKGGNGNCWLKSSFCNGQKARNRNSWKKY